MSDSFRLQILLVEDSPDDAYLLVHDLKRGGIEFDYVRVETGVQLENALDATPWDVILSDYSMAGFSGAAALNIVRRRGLDIPFIIVSGMLGEEAAVEAMKAGAADFFVKGNTKRLVPAIQREVSDARERHQRRVFEAQLRESEERFAKAFQASPIPITITTLEEGHFLNANDAYERLVGYRRDELVGRRVDDLNLRIDRGTRAETIRRLAEHGAIKGQESEIRAKDGTIKHVLVSLERIQVGTEECLLAMLYDITEQKQAEAAEQEQRAYATALRDVAALLVGSLELRTVMANILEHLGRAIAYDAATILLAEGNVARFAYAVGYGGTQPDVRQTTPLRLDEPLLQPLVAQVANAELANATDSAWAALPGHSWVHSTIGARIATHDRLIGVLVLHQSTDGAYQSNDADRLRAFADHAAVALNNAKLYSDIQAYADQLERRVDERTEQLRQAKENVESILNSTSDAIFVASPDGTIARSNPAFTMLFGQPAAAFMTASALTDGAEAGALAEALKTVTQTGRAMHLDVTCRNVDGDSFDAEIVIDPAAALWDEESALICSVRDITHRKKTEVELRAALAKEKELRELKSRFVSMITHEFRTPLAGIQSSNDLLRYYLDRLDPERRQSQFDNVDTQVRHLVRLLDDILKISRSDLVGLDYKPAVTDLGALGETLLNETMHVATKHQFEFTVSGDCSRAFVDESLMRQTILNLLSNAVKYSEPDSTIWFTIANDDDCYRIEVRDEGIGIPEDDRVRLFEIFHRGSNVGLISGTGLGLALAKLAVEAHHGHITVDSQVGKGTVFQVMLPKNHIEE